MGAAVPLIEAAGTLGHALDRLGVVVAAALAATALLAHSTRARAFAALGALVVTPILLLADIWDSPELRSLRDRPAVAGAAVLAAIAVLAVLVWVMRRWPSSLPLLVALTFPFRVPIAAGGETANLLVPLYAVIAAAVLAHAVPRARAPDDDAPFRPRALEWLLCGYVVLYAVQASYSHDFTKGLQNLVFFYVPFALLFGVLREVRWSRRLVLQCLGVLIALAVVFACVGFVEYSRKELLLNPRLIAQSQYESYFRVNSLFFDPSVYGRFLVIVMLGITTVVVWSRRGRDVLGGAALLALLWAGLVLTFSQSSFSALLVGLAVLAALRWSVRWTAATVAAAVAVGAAIVLLAPGALHLDLGSAKSTDKATSGRVDLVKGGGRLFADRPVLGWGAGSFAKVYRAREGGSDQRAASASHTIPITVAAEQGVVGLAVYLALLAAALARMLGGGVTGSPERCWVVAAFVALLWHTMLYADFLEDPTTWVLLAMGAALAAPAAQRLRSRSPAGAAA